MKKKLLFTFIFALAFLLTFTQSLDTKAISYNKNALEKALITFGVARGLNGVISVMQGTELSLEPAGIGVTLAPGEVLDPLNDLLEQFSTVMLVSAASIGTQQLLLELTNTRAFHFLSAFIFFVAITFLWVKAPLGFKGFLKKTALIFLVIRFLMPVLIMCNQLLYEQLLLPKYEHSLTKLEESSQAMQNLHTKEKEKQSVLSFFERAKESLDIDKKIKHYKEYAKTISEHTLSLIVLFIFQTLLFPLSFALASFYCLRAILRHKSLEN